MKAKVTATGEIIEVFQDFTQAMWFDKIQPYKSYHLNELEFLPDIPEAVTIEGYVARDKNNDLSLYQTYPERQSNLGYWRDGQDEIELPKESFPEVTWESEPLKIKITITPME